MPFGSIPGKVFKWKEFSRAKQRWQNLQGQIPIRYSTAIQKPNFGQPKCSKADFSKAKFKIGLKSLIRNSILMLDRIAASNSIPFVDLFSSRVD